LNQRLLKKKTEQQKLKNEQKKMKHENQLIECQQHYQQLRIFENLKMLDDLRFLNLMMFCENEIL
jgi:hypothetical protein